MSLSPPRCLAWFTLLVVKMWGHESPPLLILIFLKKKHSKVLQNLSTIFLLHHSDHSHFFNDHLFQQNLQLSQGKWAECLDPTASSARIQILLPLLEICHSKYFQYPMVLSTSSQTSVTTIKIYHHRKWNSSCGNHITTLKIENSQWKIGNHWDFSSQHKIIYVPDAY